MPLVDEDAVRTDRRSRSIWPWVLVVGGLALLWMVVSVVVSVAARQAAPTPAQAMQQQNASLLQQAQQVYSYNTQQANAYIQSVHEPSLTVMDKHTYFKVGGQSLDRSGSPAAAAKFHERYLGWAAEVKGKACAECHAPPSSIPPLRPSDIVGGALADRWTNALEKAGKLKSRREELAAQLKRKPKDQRTLLLLAATERALSHKDAADKAAATLRTVE